MTKKTQKMKKNSSYKAHRETIIASVMILFILFLSGFATAFDFDNVQNEIKEITFDNNNIKGNELLERYSPIKIKNAFGFGDTLFEGYLSQHDYNCGTNCQSIMKIKLHKEGVLIDEVAFKVLQENGKWKEKNIRGYGFYIYTKGEEIEVDDYKYQCVDGKEICNKTGCYTSQTCENIKIGSHKENKAIWNEYNLGDEVPAGIYTIQLNAQKNPLSTIDWIIKTNGEWLNKWAIWGAENGLVSYYKLDNSTGVVYDIQGGDHGALNGSTRGVTGKLNNAFDFNGSTDYFTTNKRNCTFADNFSVSSWIKIDSGDLQNGNLVHHFKLVGLKGYYLNIYDEDGRIKFWVSGGGDTFYITSNPIPVDEWHHIVGVRNGTSLSLYIDGVLNVTSTGSPINIEFTYGGNLTIGKASHVDLAYFKGKLDEIGIWNRSLSEQDIVGLYREGYGLNYNNVLKITLNSPENESMQYYKETLFNATAGIIAGEDYFIRNMSLWTNETGNWEERNITNMGESNPLNEFGCDYSSYHVINLTAHTEGIITEVQLDSCHSNYITSNVSIWQNGVLLAVKDQSSWNSDSNPRVKFVKEDYSQTIKLDVDEGDFQIKFNMKTGITGIATANSFISNFTGDFFSYTNQDVYGRPNGHDSVNTLVFNQTLSSVTKTWNRSLTEDIIWNVQGCDSKGDCDFAVRNRTSFIDIIPPNITISNPIGTLVYGKIGGNETLNVTFTDESLDSCWYNYNGTNITIEGCQDGISNATNFTLEENNYNITFYANDSRGNKNASFIEWNYYALQTNESYIEETTSGAINPFSIEFIVNNTDITLAYFYYNNTQYIGSIYPSGNDHVVNISQEASKVDTPSNITFYWNITLQNGLSFTTSPKNQSVIPLEITDVCVGNYTLYNFTLVDEQTKSKINEVTHNSSIKIDLNLYNEKGTTLLKQYSKEFSQINPVAICIDNNLSGGETYLLDLQIQYEAINYSTEFYHIEKNVLNSSNLNINITLYLLKSSHTQSFKIVARDSSYIPLPNTLIQIERKYVEDGKFYITEIPKTSERGVTSASLQINEVIYNFYVYKSGVLISSFLNVLAICQTPLVSECVIDLNEIPETIEVKDYEDDDFTFTLGYNKSTREITSVFSIPSGIPSTIQLNVINEDALGTSVCSDTITSTSGTLNCLVPSNFGNATIMAKVLRDGNEVGKGSIKLDQKPSDIFGVILITLSVLVFMTLIGVAVSDSPIITIVFIFVGAILIFSINLVENTGFIGATATILFLAIAVILILIKAGRRS